MEWLKRKLRKWIGLDGDVESLKANMKSLENTMQDLVSIGVDVHFKEPHMILIYSRLNGGQLRHIDADFKDIRDLDEFVRALRDRFKTSRETWDVPRAARSIVNQFRERAF